MGHIVAVEGHHVAEEVCAGVRVCRRHTGQSATSRQPPERVTEMPGEWGSVPDAALTEGEAWTRLKAAEDGQAKGHREGSGAHSSWDRPSV